MIDGDTEKKKNGIIFNKTHKKSEEKTPRNLSLITLYKEPLNKMQMENYEKTTTEVTINNQKV